MTAMGEGKALLVPVVVAAVLGAWALAKGPEPIQARFAAQTQASRWGKDYLPNLPVVDQDGKTYRFYDDLIKGKKVIVNFVFTSCTDICPLTTARMAQLQEKLGDMVGRDVFMYTITVDPEHDGPAELKRYADAFHVAPGWRFLTGKPADLQIIRDKLGERAKTKSEHRHEMLLGNDEIGDWSKESAYGDLDRVVMDVRAMDPSWQLPETPVPIMTVGDATYAEVNDKPGEALFVKACASCHTIGHGDKVGPDLLDVSNRREHAWLTSFVSRPDRMMAGPDAAVAALIARFPAVRMPNLGLSEQDAGDVLAYIEAQSYASKTMLAHGSTSINNAEHAGHHHQ